MLELCDLSKTYPPPPLWLRPLMRTAIGEPVIALHPTSLEVRGGEMVAVLGPNGAGKTTLVKLVCGLLRPTGGTVRIDGVDVERQSVRARARLGLVLADDRGLYWRLTGRENLEFFGVLYGLSARRARRRADELMELLDLARRDRLVFGYSSGMRTRLTIGRAMLVDPPLLILDEPTRSLDPVASLELNQLLRRLADDGRAILLASHRLDEVREFCDRAVVLLDGRIRREAGVRDLRLDSSDLLALLRDDADGDPP